MQFGYVELTMKKRIVRYFITLCVTGSMVFTLSCENTTLLTIGDVRYTMADFKEVVQFAPTDDSLQRLEKINDFIGQRLMYIEGDARGYADDPVVRVAFETHQKEIIYRGFYEEQVVNRVQVAESEIKKMYDQMVEQYHLAQIVIDDESLGTFVVQQLQQGVPFESLLHYSLDTLTENGDIGNFAVMSLPPEILEAVKKTKDGATTTLIHFGEYYYILKVIERLRTETPTFESIRENLKQSLQRDKIEERARQFISEIVEDAKVEYNDKGLEACIKPDSLITEEDLNTWVVKKYDTAFVYVRTLRNAVMYQYQRSAVEPKMLIERVLIPDLIYDKAQQERFDRTTKIKKRLDDALSFLIYQKFYSDEILEKVDVDSSDVESYFSAHRDDYPDKELADVFSLVKARLRDEQITAMRKQIQNELWEKYQPEVNETVVSKLLKEE